MVIAGALIFIIAAIVAVPAATGTADVSPHATNVKQAEAPLPAPGAAQNAGTPSPDPAPVITRDAAGHATVRAIRLTTPLRIDGALDEEIYQTVPAIDDFIQQVPKEGAPATERTEAWVAFDSANMYVAARCWDSAPPDDWVANELRRDTDQLRNNDSFGVLFDTFHDRRNGFAFYANPIGGLADFLVTDEGNPNKDWNTVWEVRTGRFDGGWTIEMAIPFKSLRYRSGSSQTWGIQLRRVIRRKNEWTYLTPIPLSAATTGGGGASGIFRVSAAGTLVGLELPAASKNLELKPYAISSLTTDHLRTPVVSNDVDGNLGIDAKYGVNANLTADFTYNTDFAQVEVDEQQVNLTRFSLFFPEKREFFLEGRGIFEFGRGTGATGGNPFSFTGVAPLLFFSRRIGLHRNRVIPIEVGGRLTGKAGKFGVGVLNIQTDAAPAAGSSDRVRATNFTVLRVKRDILRRSSIGAMFTNRSRSTVADGSNQAYGLDGAFSLRQDVYVNGYIARTRTPGLKKDDTSYQVRLDWAADRYGLQLDHLLVGDNFNPEVGFIRRDDFRRTFASARFSPRPRSIDWVRKFTWEGSLEYILDGAGAVETRQQQGRFNIELENSDQFNVEATSNYELLVQPFAIARDVSIPVGGYQFSDVVVTYTFGAQRRASGAVSLERGSFYRGTITGLGYSRGRVEVTPALSVEPSLAINRIELPQGTFTTRLLRSRVDYAFSPRMFASALLQYNSSDRTFGNNFRFRWEYRPGSEFFIVYTDERDTVARGPATLNNRAFVIKITRLLRF